VCLPYFSTVSGKKYKTNKWVLRETLVVCPSGISPQREKETNKVLSSNTNVITSHDARNSEKKETEEK
jgi:hypothetical protein